MPLVNVKYLAMYKVQKHAGAISKLLFYVGRIMVGNNPLVKARGLSSRTDAQTI